MHRPWEQAWCDALYGPEGFYRRPEGPSGHFATTAAGMGRPVTDVLARALIALARRHGLSAVTDIGAGGGHLLSALHEQAPEMGMTGVDVGPRPAGLPAAARWVVAPGGALLPAVDQPSVDQLDDLDGLVVGNEWLDVVPCPVVQRAEAGGPWCYVEVDAGGTEHRGTRVQGADLAWLRRWVPAEQVTRAEVGRARDEAVAALLGRIRRGVLVLIDYGHTITDRPEAGSLVGFRGGRLVPPVPDGSTDITAHVAFDSLGADRLMRQREALVDLLPRPPRPDPASAAGDGLAYLSALQQRSAYATAVAQGGLGDFWWALWERPGSAVPRTQYGGGDGATNR